MKEINPHKIWYRIKIFPFIYISFDMQSSHLLQHLLHWHYSVGLALFFVSSASFSMFPTVLEVHHGVYRQRPTILQRQQYVCLQLQFRSPLVEAIGKEQIVFPTPPTATNSSQFGPLFNTRHHTYMYSCRNHCFHGNYTSKSRSYSVKTANFEVTWVDFSVN
jgi:hypothetical protein